LLYSFKYRFSAFDRDLIRASSEMALFIKYVIYVFSNIGIIYEYTSGESIK
jgi:hypothetical protein